MSRPNNNSSTNDLNNGYYPDVPTGDVNNSTETTIADEDPFKDFGNEVVLTDDDLPF